MEKFREIEVDIQNKINEMLGIDTLFDDYVNERNKYDKELFNSLLCNNSKLSNKINQAIEFIEETKCVFGTNLDMNYLLKILKGEGNESNRFIKQNSKWGRSTKEN